MSYYNDKGFQLICIKASLMNLKGQSNYCLLYYYVFFCQGMYSNSLGTLIPFLSAARNIPQTEYSFLFMARTIGSLIGIAIYKYIHNRNYRGLEHKVLIASGIVYFIFMIVFVEWNTKLGQWIGISLTGGAYYCTITAANICILLIASTKKGKQIIVGYGLFGVGALISPQLIIIFQQETYFYMSFFYFPITILCSIYPMPSQRQKLQSSQKRIDKIGSFKLQILFIVAFFFIVGIELTLTGWIPSYAVMTGASTKEEATIYATIYYIFVVVLRFSVPKIPFSNTKKLTFMLIAMLICSFVCVIFQYGHQYGKATIFGSIFYGFSVSLLYPLALVVSSEYSIAFRPKQTANMMTASAFSSGFLTGLTGLLMKSNIEFLFYSLIIMSIALLINFMIIFKILTKESSQIKMNDLELKEILQVKQ